MGRDTAFWALSLGVLAGVLIGLLSVGLKAPIAPPHSSSPLTGEDTPSSASSSQKPNATWQLWTPGPRIRDSLRAKRLWGAAAELADTWALRPWTVLFGDHWEPQETPKTDPGATCSSNGTNLQDWLATAQKLCLQLLLQYDTLQERQNTDQRQCQRSGCALQQQKGGPCRCTGSTLPSAPHEVLSGLWDACGIPPSAAARRSLQRSWERKMEVDMQGGEVGGDRARRGTVDTLHASPWYARPSGEGEGAGEARWSQLEGAWPAWLRGAQATRGASPGASRNAQGNAKGGEGRGEGEGGGEGRGFGAGLSIMLQYWKQDLNTLKDLLMSFFRCIKGSMGDKGEDALQQAGGNPPLEAGEMEFLANVDQPRESPTWVHFWRTAVNASATGAAAPEGASNGTAAAGGGASGGRVGGGRRFSFLVVVFNHNLHENRGYNRLARMARGSAVSMNQDDNLNSQRCNWSRRLLDEMNTRPLVALVGVNGGVVRQSAGGHFMIDPGNFRKDPVTGNFVNYDGLVDIGPMIHPTSAWLALGGIDESYGPRGQAGIFGDWQLSLRTWLAGYRVMHLQSSDGYERGNEGEGTTRVKGSKSSYFRDLNSGLNGGDFWPKWELYARFALNESFRSMLLFRPVHEFAMLPS